MPGFIKGSRVLDDRGQEIPIEMVQTREFISGVVDGKPFSVMVKCAKLLTTRLCTVETETGAGFRGAPDSLVFQYSGYTHLYALQPGSILLFRKGDPVRVKSVKTISMCAPVYHIETYPELPYIVNSFIVGHQDGIRL